MAKKGFLDGYKTYNPVVEGYGNSEQWRNAFFERLGIDEAYEILNEEDPLIVLGIVDKKPTWDEIQRAFRRKILQWHPDQNQDNEEAAIMAKKVIAAFEILEQRYGK